MAKVAKWFFARFARTHCQMRCMIAAMWIILEHFIFSERNVRFVELLWEPNLSLPLLMATLEEDFLTKGEIEKMVGMA